MGDYEYSPFWESPKNYPSPKRGEAQRGWMSVHGDAGERARVAADEEGEAEPRSV